jgi:hypothetical protein
VKEGDASSTVTALPCPVVITAGNKKYTYRLEVMLLSIGGLFKRGEVEKWEVTRSLLGDIATL